MRGLPLMKLGYSGFWVSQFWRSWSQLLILGPRVKVALGLKGCWSSGSEGSASDRISARMRLVSSIRFWLTASASEEPRLTPMVPRRTRMVTKPHRIVILMLLKVFWIWRPRGSPVARPRALEVGKALLVLRLWWLSCPMSARDLGNFTWNESAKSVVCEMLHKQRMKARVWRVFVSSDRGLQTKSLVCF